MSRKSFFSKYLFRIENFLSQNILKVFLETTLVHVSCYPDHYEPKIFFLIFVATRCIPLVLLHVVYPSCTRSVHAGQRPFEAGSARDQKGYSVCQLSCTRSVHAGRPAIKRDYYTACVKIFEVRNYPSIYDFGLEVSP